MAIEMPSNMLLYVKCSQIQKNTHTLVYAYEPPIGIIAENRGEKMVTQKTSQTHTFTQTNEMSQAERRNESGSFFQAFI